MIFSSKNTNICHDGIPVWRRSRRRDDPGLLLLLSHGHDLLLLLGQTLHLRLQEAQRRVQPLDGASVICEVDFPRSHTCISTVKTQVSQDTLPKKHHHSGGCLHCYSSFHICKSELWLSPFCLYSPPLSSQGDLGAAPSGLHLSARSMLLWPVSFEDVSGSGEGVSAPPELGLRGAVTPFLLTTFRKAVLPIF